MNELVIFIDDELKETSDYVQYYLKPLIEVKCKRRLKVINKAEEINIFIRNLGDAKLVLLDRDLSKIRKNSVDILNSLYKKNIPVIILSRYKPTEKPYGVEDFRKLDKRLDYLLKDDIHTEDQEKKEFVKNLINRAIDDPKNKELIATVNCNTGKIGILWKNTKNLITDNILLKCDHGWETRTELPVSNPQEAILRILYEMGKRKVTEIKVKDIYRPATTRIIDKKDYESLKNELIQIKPKGFIPEELKLEIDTILKLINEKNKKIPMNKLKKIILSMEVIYKKDDRNKVIESAIEGLKEISGSKIQLPPKFGDTLSSFNEDVRKETKGLLVGSLLKGTKGRGKDIYIANIYKIELEGSKIPRLSWQEEIEERLKRLELEVDFIKQSLPQPKKN